MNKKQKTSQIYYAKMIILEWVHMYHKRVPHIIIIITIVILTAMFIINRKIKTKY